jgi:hypothetical protein
LEPVFGKVEIAFVAAYAVTVSGAVAAKRKKLPFNVNGGDGHLSREGDEV